MSRRGGDPGRAARPGRDTREACRGARRVRTGTFTCLGARAAHERQSVACDGSYRAAADSRHARIAALPRAQADAFCATPAAAWLLGAALVPTRATPA